MGTEGVLVDEEKTQSMEQPEMAPEGATAGAAETERAAGEAPAIEPATAPEAEPTAASMPVPAAGFGPEPATASEAATEQKPSKKSAIIIVIALVAVVALGIVAYNVLSSNNAGAGSGSGAANSELPSALQPKLSHVNSVVEDEMENSYDLVGIADGKPLVINFWATWCPHCIKEMPAFQAAFEQYGDRVSFAMIDTVDGTRETVEDGSAFVFENGFTFPVYYDVKQNAAIDFGVSVMPATVIFDAEGNVVYSKAGAMDIDTLNSLLADFAK